MSNILPFFFSHIHRVQPWNGRKPDTATTGLWSRQFFTRPLFPIRKLAGFFLFFFFVFPFVSMEWNLNGQRPMSLPPPPCDWWLLILSFHPEKNKKIKFPTYRKIFTVGKITSTSSQRLSFVTATLLWKIIGKKLEAPDGASSEPSIDVTISKTLPAPFQKSAENTSIRHFSTVPKNI
jgi:hypothetical protein